MNLREMVPGDGAVLLECHDSIARDVAQSDLHVASRTSSRARVVAERTSREFTDAGTVEADVLARIGQQIEDS